MDNDKNNVAMLFNETRGANIKNLIHVIREKQIILDRDLAELYEVETKNLNKAAARNKERFPEDFRFRLTREEADILRFQIGTLAGQKSEIGRTYLPWVYTEQGIAIMSVNSSNAS